MQQFCNLSDIIPSMVAVAFKMPRKEFSARVKHAAWERANGYCEGQVLQWIDGELTTKRCNAPIDIGNFHYDHIDPDWFGADERDQLSNCQVLCRACHVGKTKNDIARIAKAKRIIRKRIKAKRTGRPMLGSRQSGWKKTFNHGWVRR